MRQFTRITKALADETRLRILMALAGERELCAGQLTALIGLAPSTMSRHLAQLADAGLLEQRKDGRNVWFRRSGPEAGAAVRNTYAYLQHCLALRPQIRDDAQRLAELQG